MLTSKGWVIWDSRVRKRTFPGGVGCFTDAKGRSAYPRFLQETPLTATATPNCPVSSRVAYHGSTSIGPSRVSLEPRKVAALTGLPERHDIIMAWTLTPGAEET